MDHLSSLPRYRHDIVDAEADAMYVRRPRFSLYGGSQKYQPMSQLHHLLYTWHATMACNHGMQPSALLFALSSELTHPLFFRTTYGVAEIHEGGRRLGLGVDQVVGGGAHEIRREGRPAPRHVENETRRLQVARRVGRDGVLRHNHNNNNNNNNNKQGSKVGCLIYYTHPTRAAPNTYTVSITISNNTTDIHHRVYTPHDKPYTTYPNSKRTTRHTSTHYNITA